MTKKQVTEESLKMNFDSFPSNGIFQYAKLFIEDIMESKNQSVLMIANTGLWFNTVEAFTEVMPGILEWLYRLNTMINRRNKVFWHETVSQHWMSVDNSGFFFLKKFYILVYFLYNYYSFIFNFNKIFFFFF
jgi:hypothetical protein